MSLEEKLRATRRELKEVREELRRHRNYIEAIVVACQLSGGNRAWADAYTAELRELEASA